MKPIITLLLALLLIGVIGFAFIPIAIIAMAIVLLSCFVYIAQQCKELNRNGFGKKNEL